MSDTTTDADEQSAAAAAEAPDQDTEPETEDSGPSKRTAIRYLEWAGLGLSVLLVFIAGLRVYWGVGALISIWVAPKFEPFVSVGFNLTVLLLAAYATALLSRRLTGRS